MKMKKGNMLTNETLKMILAVACLALLIYATYILYTIGTGKTRTEQAKSQLDAILGKMSGMQKGESVNYSLLSPKDYVLVAWPYRDEKGQYIPDSCLQRNYKQCICLCHSEDKKEYLLDSEIKIVSDLNSPIKIFKDLFLNGNIVNQMAERCTKEGFCRELSANASTSSIIFNEESSLMEKLREVDYGASLKPFFERVFSIRVDDLVKKGRFVQINYKEGGYEIIPA